MALLSCDQEMLGEGQACVSEVFQVCVIAGQYASVHARHLAAVSEEVWTPIVDGVPAACGNQKMTMWDNSV